MSSHTVQGSNRDPLCRAREGRLVGGVASGLAQKLDVDVTLVRLAITALALCGPGVPLYLAAWILISEAGAEKTIASDIARFVRRGS